MNFPDTERATIELLETPEVKAVLHVPSDLDKSLPLIHVMGLPSAAQIEPWERIDRIQLDIYAVGRSEANKIARGIDRIFGHQSTSEGFLDDIYYEVTPSETPLVSDTISLYTAIIRIESRPKR